MSLSINQTTTSSRRETIDIYRKWARHYDSAAKLYDIGFRAWEYRKQAVESLNVQKGDTVVDLCCGTGLNFSLLQKAVGLEGKIIGVDLTDAMLEQARKRVEKQGWSNVDIVQADAVSFQFPPSVDGIISTYALTLIPEFDRVILNGCQALLPGKRWVVLDLKVPSNKLAWFAPLLSFLFMRPFGAKLSMATRHPWESIDKYLKNTSLSELYGGFVYIAVGKQWQDSC